MMQANVEFPAAIRSRNMESRGHNRTGKMEKIWRIGEIEKIEKMWKLEKIEKYREMGQIEEKRK